MLKKRFIKIIDLFYISSTFCSSFYAYIFGWLLVSFFAYRKNLVDCQLDVIVLVKCFLLIGNIWLIVG